jgi:hypothetical protein
MRQELFSQGERVEQIGRVIESKGQERIAIEEELKRVQNKLG